MAAAAGAGDLCACHPEAAVLMELHGVGHRRLREARPTGARVELRVRAEQLGPARAAAVDPVRLRVRVRTGERRLGALLTQDVETLRIQLLAPLLLGLLELFSH